MNAKFQKSVDRARRLLGTAAGYEHYVAIRIQPVPSECCCLRHWSATWTAIDAQMRPCGPGLNEGDSLIRSDDLQFVLECHESGPEILVYLAAGTVVAGLAKSIVELITTILKARQEQHRASVTFRLTSINYEGAVQETELSLPLSEHVAQRLTDYVESSLVRGASQNPARANAKSDPATKAKY